MEGLIAAGLLVFGLAYFLSECLIKPVSVVQQERHRTKRAAMLRDARTDRVLERERAKQSASSKEITVVPHAPDQSAEPPSSKTSMMQRIRNGFQVFQASRKRKFGNGVISYKGQTFVEVGSMSDYFLDILENGTRPTPYHDPRSPWYGSPRPITGVANAYRSFELGVDEYYLVVADYEGGFSKGYLVSRKENSPIPLQPELKSCPRSDRKILDDAKKTLH